MLQVYYISDIGGLLEQKVILIGERTIPQTNAACGLFLFSRKRNDKIESEVKLLPNVQTYRKIRFFEKVRTYIRAVVEAMNQAFTMKSEREYRESMLTGCTMLDGFLEDIQSKKYEPIATGLEALDRITNGGFLRRSLVMLGAAPGMGKTTFSQQIFETMAQNEHEILFFNLEICPDTSCLLSHSHGT